MALFVSGLMGGRVEPMVGGALLTAAAVVAAILHPQPRGLLHQRVTHSRVEAWLALLGAAAGISYAVMMLTAARGAGPSCFLGQCVHGDRLAEMAAAALTIPAPAALAAWRVDGWRLPLWSAGIGAVTLGATSILLPSVSGSLGVLGGTAAIAWGVLLIERGEHARTRTRKTATR